MPTNMIEGASPVTESVEKIPHGQSPLALAFASLGVVYGDIGTSPLYAMKESFHPHFGLEPTIDNVYGICSLFFWALTLVISIKHIVFVMRADNNGEGGTMALLSLITPKIGGIVQKKSTKLIIMMGLIGASLFAADGTITPAITVLSAVEGLGIAAPSLNSFILPIAVVILILLFQSQKHGTADIAKFFAPSMFLWFLVIAVIAIPPIIQHPDILKSVNPIYGIKLLLTHGYKGFLVLGAVVLCITGGEALYADMGHFGRGPIRMAWFPIVMPALLLNYWGQGALVLQRGAEVLENPFYALVSGIWVYPLVILATLASVIASQALISGAFSLGQQAIQLGFSPRLTVVHTSGETKGQIFIPEINTILMVICIGLALGFRESSALAGAYGISVMGTMMITSCLLFVVAHRRWMWPLWKSALMTLGFLAVEIPFFLANLPKIEDGGWFPVVICLIVFSLMTTWKRGRTALVRRLQTRLGSVKEFVKNLREDSPPRVKGTAVFMTPNPRVVPPALMHHYKHNQVLHEQVLLLAIVTEDIPVVATKEILEVNSVGENIYELVAHYGFMQTPQVARILRLAKAQYGIYTDTDKTSFFLGRDILLTNGPEPMMHWRKTLFAFLVRNSVPATAYFGIPPDRVIEMGMQVKL